MLKKKDFIINGKHNKPILIDVSYLANTTNNPIIIFCHGYKGFKDWGAWNIMAEYFANAGFCFIKFNFSHNGGTIEQPIDFPDLEAFGNNNYTKELDDLQSVINWCFENATIKKTGNLDRLALIGHSRGGGIVSIKANEDNRVKAIISLAGVSDFLSRTIANVDVETWEKTGVKYVLNGRTKQQMPHYYQFYLDTVNNKDRLNIKNAVSNLKIPHLIIHGDNDTSVFIDEAENLHKWNPKSTLEIIKGANHVFESRHPWDTNKLPKALKEVVNKTIFFLNSK
ncbi:alpha/beta hydrolase [Seonamhaeicola sp. S2-3]|uniref:alpha/beta hydrolase family protein n=1 Tax=Seonamhaeicola sp. S2-3 TaxID=1936081 RepID=UPI000972E8F2|nr:alpha/beta fold hydrolase [Seonamhaeicola sp. S2-3]APY10895.1 alpha/beta hydrolase [Seonamhaeicola sp. S2-3]